MTTSATSATEPAFKCFMCDRPEVADGAWTLDSLYFIYGRDDERRDLACCKLCKKHLEFCRARIEELKAQAPPEPPRAPEWIPPMPDLPNVKPDVPGGKNFYEREPGEDG